MDYTTISVVSLKRMCKERNLRGYSNKKKNELISLLHQNEEEEKKSLTNNDDTQDEITLLKEEIKRLRTSNLFLDIISSDTFDFIKNNINQKKPLHIDDIHIGDKVEFYYRGELWVGVVNKKYIKTVGVKATNYKGKEKISVNWKCSVNALTKTNKDI